MTSWNSAHTIRENMCGPDRCCRVGVSQDCSANKKEEEVIVGALKNRNQGAGQVGVWKGEEKYEESGMKTRDMTLDFQGCQVMGRR